ncbi:site-specific integrase [Vibrio agarivorans]|uniref:site-specific integrase n=1 Tax=Vibrio agarivorans TaxID=153622 RepID=UPI0025B2BF59|nr:site-specific integrase [Vibrio agarivorans]MDN3662211.1 site-specific integrase [Vibrio agarivorans]
MEQRLCAKWICDYHHTNGLDVEPLEEIEWVLTTLAPQAREITPEQLKRLNLAISQIKDGRQRRRKKARDQCLYYLKEVNHWPIPEVASTQWRDTNREWMMSILAHSEQATALLDGHRLQSPAFYQTRWAHLGWTLLLLNIEVAPLPLKDWQAILQNPDAIEWFDGQYTLKVIHRIDIAAFASKSTPSFTRYPLSPVAYRALEQYYQSPSEVLSIKALTEALNDWVSGEPYYLEPISTHQWQRAFACLWYYHHELGASLLKDVCDPTRHVATLHPVRTNTLTASEQKALYTPPSFTPTVTSKKKSATTWPHKALIRYHQNLRQGRIIPKPKAPDWQEDNILPALLFHRTETLFVEGGVKREKLHGQSIVRYNNFHSHLTPLSFATAITPDALHEWVREQWTRLDDSSDGYHFYQFLCSMAQHSLIDHLDLSLFQSPSLPSKVDPFCLMPEHIDSLVETLLNAPGGHGMQRIFCAVAALLGFYATLRRGETLRLRLGDISVHPQDRQCFIIEITKTKEGDTKNKKPRTVHAYLPSEAAKLVRVLQKIKEGGCKDDPLLGFSFETIGDRARRYLYPVTQALKGLFGQSVRYHHLRHSGAQLLVLQGLTLAFDRDEKHLMGIGPLTRSLLTPQTCQARFHFWLEGQPLREVNSALLLDVITEELGHTHYATTRRHYLHGLELFLALVKDKNERYSRDKLRYVLGMPAGSNDISRVVAQLCPDYAALPHIEKKHYSPALSASKLFHRLNPKGVVKDKDGATSTAKPETNLYQLWFTSLPKQMVNTDSTHLTLFCHDTFAARSQPAFSFKELEQAWQVLSHKGQALTLSPTQQTQLKKLAPFYCVHQETLSLYTCVKFNQPDLAAVQALFQEGPFCHFDVQCLLVQNRKRLSSLKVARFMAQFQTLGFAVEQQKINHGDSALYLIIDTHLSPDFFQHQFKHYWQALLPDSPQEDLAPSHSTVMETTL